MSISWTVELITLLKRWRQIAMRFRFPQARATATPPISCQRQYEIVIKAMTMGWLKCDATIFIDGYSSKGCVPRLSVNHDRLEAKSLGLPTTVSELPSLNCTSIVGLEYRDSQGTAETISAGLITASSMGGQKSYRA